MKYSVNKEHQQKRYRAERRFRMYGKCAIGVALVSLILLLATVVERGWKGFLSTEIKLTVMLDAATFGPDKATWKYADTAPLLKTALLKKFPDVTERRALRELVGLLSSDASIELRRLVVANPDMLGKEVPVWFIASDVVDRFNKSRKDTPHLRITERQRTWLSALRASGDVRRTLNTHFFTTGDSREPEMAGFMGSIIGSLLTLLACMLSALPLGVMAAIYLEEFAVHNRITEWIEISINNLAAVPSIVFGLLGLAVYLNVFGLPRSAPLAGGLTLALMILPTIIITTRASLRAVPDSIRDAARGLGASPLQVVLHHTFPLAMPGVMTGTILGLARAMGETAPLLMIGMVAFIVDIPRNLSDAATAMPVQIYLWATSPEPSFVEKTAAGILVLLVILIALNSIAILLRRKFEHKW
jgi:phosphate transport system permease protein